MSRRSARGNPPGSPEPLAAGRPPASHQRLQRRLSGPVTPPPGHPFDRGDQSCRARRPAALLQDREEDNRGGTAGARVRWAGPGTPPTSRPPAPSPSMSAPLPSRSPAPTGHATACPGAVTASSTRHFTPLPSRRSACRASGSVGDMSSLSWTRSAGLWPALEKTVSLSAVTSRDYVVNPGSVCAASPPGSTDCQS